MKEGESTAEVLANNQEQVLLCQGEAPKSLVVDGNSCDCQVQKHPFPNASDSFFMSLP